ncbi:MAG: stalk domain-containing protein [Clostridia bacterium]
MIKKMKYGIVGFIFGLIISVSVVFASTGIEVEFLPLKYFFDGVEKTPPSEQKGFVYKGTTYVPIRFIAESLGKGVTWEGETSSIYIGEQLDGNITYMEDMKTFTANDYYFEKVNSFETNTGAKYLHGYKAYRNGSYNNIYNFSGKLEYEYLLEGKYKKFTGYIAPSTYWNSQSKYNDIGSFEIYADDKLVFKTGEIASDILEPIEFDLDLTGVVQLKIVAEDCVEVGILDAKFIN